LVVISLVSSFTQPHVSWGCHLGGLMGGILVTAVSRFGDRSSVRVLAFVGPAAVAVIAVMSTVVIAEASSGVTPGVSGFIRTGEQISCPVHGPACSAVVIAQVWAPTSRAASKPLFTAKSMLTIEAGKATQVVVPFNARVTHLLAKTGRLELAMSIITRVGDGAPHKISRIGEVTAP
jgi:hypothetical protein